MGYLNRKEEIVLSAITLIHEQGVSNVSMKAIANREGVTEASLYKHYKSKNELLNAVIAYYEQYDQYIYNTLRNSHENAVESIFKYFHIYAEYYQNYKEITALINAYDVLIYNTSFSERTKKMIEEKKNFVEMLVQKAQEDNELCTQIQPESMAYILLGSFDRIIAMWRLTDYSFCLDLKTGEVIRDVLQAFKI